MVGFGKGDVFGIGVGNGWDGGYGSGGGSVIVDLEDVDEIGVEVGD